MKPLLIIGSGDHAFVTEDIARALGRPSAGFVDAQPAAESHRGRVLGDLEQDRRWLASYGNADFVVAIGSNRHRASAFEVAIALGLTPTSLVHPSAMLLGGCSIGHGTQVCAAAVIGVEAEIGINVIVNTGATVDHHNQIGAHAFIGPGAHLAGRVQIGEGAHVGIGASVREGIVIGAWAVVAAGAAVVDDVPDGGRWAGVPARPMNSESVTGR